MRVALWRTALLGLVLVGLVLVAASCGSGDESATETTLDVVESTVATTTPTTASSTTTAPTTTEPTTTEAPTTTTVADVCPTAELSPGSDTPSVQADVNGDNELDTAFARRIGENWVVVVQYGGGGTATLPLTDSDPVSNVRIIGAVDFTSTGFQELAISVGSGAYTEQIGFVRSRECELLRLAFESDAPAAFLSGASIGNFSGMLCAPGLVEQYEFTLNGDSEELSYEGGFTPYLLEDDTFVQGFGDGTVLSADELASIKTFDCFGLSL